MKKFFDKIDGKFASEFKRKVLDSPSIVLASHISPDDDSIYSVLGMHYYLTKILGVPEKQVNILYTWEKTEQQVVRS